MPPLAVVVLAATLGGPPDGGAPPRFEGEKTTWHGFDRYDFLTEESDLTVKPFKVPVDEGTADQVRFPVAVRRQLGR